MSPVGSLMIIHVLLLLSFQLLVYFVQHVSRHACKRKLYLKLSLECQI